MEWFAFISGDGRMAGVARRTGEGGDDFSGVVVAIVERACDISEWRELLIKSSSPAHAAEMLVKEHGGVTVFKAVPIHSATRVFFTPSVAEA